MIWTLASEEGTVRQTEKRRMIVTMRRMLPALPLVLPGLHLADGFDAVFFGDVPFFPLKQSNTSHGDGENYSSGPIDIADRSSETAGRLPVSSSILAYRSPRG